jgi:hypothetical protein
MKSFRSYKINRKIKYLAAAGLAAAYVLGFSARAYSPAHIGRYAIPIPTLIPIINTLKMDSNHPAGNNQTVSLPKTLAEVTAIQHQGIITTVFWAGEKADSDNGGIANFASAWDAQWVKNYGGEDKPIPRSGFFPANFTPKENPFYFALPYNDLDSHGKRKSTASSCPNAVNRSPYSWCKNSWIAIRHNNKTVYAQWEDVGPFNEDDSPYVFGGAMPSNTEGEKAGLDVSPAVQSYLGLEDVDSCDWQFIAYSDVPDGPWKLIVSTHPGYSVN